MRTIVPALLLAFTAVSGGARSRTATSAPILQEETMLATEIEHRAHIERFDFSGKSPRIALDRMSAYDGPEKNTIHEARWADVPPVIQEVFRRWASYTDDYPNGAELFHDMFHRFFFVHEFGHWFSDQVLAQRQDEYAKVAARNAEAHRWQYEMVANHISIAWWRERDPRFLEKLVQAFRIIEAELPNPIPAGRDVEQFFTTNYESLAEDPNKYGWYQLRMVIIAYDEKPAMTFQEAIDTLPAENYDK